MDRSPVPSNPAPAPARANSSRRNGLRRWIPYLGAVALVSLIAAGLWPQPAPVEVLRVGRGELRSTVNEEGKTRIRHRYTVCAPVTGQLRRIPFKAGASVCAGETVVAVIDPIAPAPLDERSRALAVAARDAAAANLERARAALAFARSELRRTERLHAEQTASTQELESAQWRETAAAREFTAAEAELRHAEAQLVEFGTSPGAPPSGGQTPVEIRAPVSGRVLRVFEESSRVVTSSTPLVEIGDPADLEVVIEVLSRDGAMIRPGDEVILEQWGGREPLAARVRLVEPAAFLKISALGVEEQRVNVIADLLTPPEQRAGLGDQFRVEARIVTWKAPDALKVAAGALFRHGAGWAVFVVENGHARLRPVRIGPSSGLETQVLDGVQEGDAVILYPGDRIRDGERVRTVVI
jgi:HlyD family secretion protein